MTSTLRDLTAGSGFTFQSRGQLPCPLARPHDRARRGDLTWVHHRPLTDAGVSEREAEVLALVSEHLTNQQIAGRLAPLGSHRREPRVVAAAQARGGRPPRAGRARRGTGRTPRRSTRHLPAVAALPTPLTSFVGRAAERAALAGALAEHRLVTAVGPGGVGKTRLALAVAEDVGEPARRWCLLRRPGAGHGPGDGGSRAGGRLRVRGAAGAVARRDGGRQARRRRGAAGAGQLRAPARRGAASWSSDC